MRAGGSNVAEHGHNILAQLTLSGEVELLHLRISIIWSYALEGVKGRSGSQIRSRGYDGKALRDKKAGDVVSRLIDI